MKLKLIRNNDNFVIISADTEGKYKIKLLDLYVEFRKIVVDQSILRREVQLFESGKPYLMQIYSGQANSHHNPEGEVVLFTTGIDYWTFTKTSYNWICLPCKLQR